MGILTRFVVASFVLTLSFQIVNLTGVFPYNVETTPFTNPNIKGQISSIHQALSQGYNPLSILAATYHLFWLAATGLFTLVWGLFGSWPALFHMFLIPMPLADLLGGTLDLVMFIGLLEMLRK